VREITEENFSKSSPRWGRTHWQSGLILLKKISAKPDYRKGLPVKLLDITEESFSKSGLPPGLHGKTA